MKTTIKVFFSLALILLILSTGLAGGVLIDRKVLLPNQQVVVPPAGAAQDFNLIGQAWKTIQNQYVDQQAIQPTQMTYAAISGMVDSLGDTGHSSFLSPDMLQSQNDYLQGQFDGIGAEVQMKDGHVVIVAPLDNSPAQKAGIQPGDIILKVDEKDVSNATSLSQVVSLILGPAGTQVSLTLLNPQTGTQRSVTITRGHIQVNNVSWQMLPGTHIAHLRIAGFSNGVTNDLKKALSEIKAQNATGLILDLRNDPGGLLDEAIGVASQFLNGGDVLLEKDAQGNTKAVPVTKGGTATQIPMVVLINQGTASASEIVSGALQDAHRATLIGETTFGTGTVLTPFPLSDGSALLLATQEWLTPSGRQIWHQGITPDQNVVLTAGAVPLIPEAEQGMTSAQLSASKDNQLLQAVQLLNGGQASSNP